MMSLALAGCDKLFSLDHVDYEAPPRASPALSPMTTDSDEPSPAGELTTATQLAVGNAGTCAIIGGAVKCVGEWRMLGNGDPSLSVPTAVDLQTGACTQ